MSWLVMACLKNAFLALPLVLAALAVGRLSRRPAFAHVLWVLVLVKLITPPLVDVPLGWKLDVEAWLGGEPGQLRPIAAPLAASPTATHAQVPQASASPAVAEHQRTLTSPGP